jgi:hypothetical protein
MNQPRIYNDNTIYQAIVYPIPYVQIQQVL